MVICGHAKYKCRCLKCYNEVYNVLKQIFLSMLISWFIYDMNFNRFTFPKTLFFKTPFDFWKKKTHKLLSFFVSTVSWNRWTLTFYDIKRTVCQFLIISDYFQGPLSPIEVDVKIGSILEIANEVRILMLCNSSRKC